VSPDRAAAAPRKLSRLQILGHRRRMTALDERLPLAPESLRMAAWAGLQDSMPRAALLSIHARVAGAGPSIWEHPSLAQLWGPRFSAYVVAARDVPVFSLGRHPTDSAGQRRAVQTADRLEAYLAGRRMSYADAGHGLGIPPNALRYAATTGRVLMRWDGARRPIVWMIPPPAMEPGDARLELARRYLRVFGPATAAGFRRWAGVAPAFAQAVFEQLAPELTRVLTPIGEGVILTADEAKIRALDGPPEPAASGPSHSPRARLLPSGDAYLLLQDRERALLVPEPARRAALWTPRVWPGGVLLGDELVGTWRRAGADLAIDPWQPLASRQRAAVEAEAERLPLPGITSPIRVIWG
jgi:hypothetical protein